MCVMSMIYDHYHEKWKNLPLPTPDNSEPPITDAEKREFRQLLERAREYDRKHNQPDCELEEKREKLRKLSKDLGVEIEFV